MENHTYSTSDIIGILVLFSPRGREFSHFHTVIALNACVVRVQVLKEFQMNVFSARREFKVNLLLGNLEK